MSRILNLQKVLPFHPDEDTGGGSTSSESGACHCSTPSVDACFMGNDLIAI